MSKPIATLLRITRELRDAFNAFEDVCQEEAGKLHPDATGHARLAEADRHLAEVREALMWNLALTDVTAARIHRIAFSTSRYGVRIGIIGRWGTILGAFERDLLAVRAECSSEAA